MKKGLAVAMAALLGVATMGTTAMAAKNLKRNFIGFEINENYYLLFFLELSLSLYLKRFFSFTK